MGVMGVLRAVADVGFVFWGVFVVFLAIVAAYVVWMIRTERP